MLEEALVRGLNESGVDAVRDRPRADADALLCRRPMLDVDGGIMITGSHNPADYNGFKMVLRGRAFFGADIQELGRMAAAGDWERGRRRRSPTWR